MAADSVRVLLVEDEVLIQQWVEFVLEDSGFKVVIASSGEEAIAILEAEDRACRALITDVNLGPGPNGWTVARRARELDQQLPVVYISGGNMHEWAANGVANSVLLAKPFPESQLVTVVAQLLSARDR